MPGGKALARLNFLEEERGIRDTEIAPTRRARQPEAAAYPGLNGDDGSTSPYLEAFRELTARRQREAAVPIAQGWRPLGPFSIPHGQTYGSGPGSRPSVSGRISSVAVNPANRDHILIGAGGGGIWESTDRGATWQPRGDDQPSLAIGALAFTPGNPQVVYAGTGEGDALWFLGAGLLRSTDGGATWSLHAAAPFAGTGFYDLVVDPLNPNHLLAATRRGLYESSDGGTNWVQRRNVKTWDVSIHPPVAGDPASTQEAFAGTEGGLVRSTDGGATWNGVALPGAPGGFTRIEVCHAPSNGDVVYVFAAGTDGLARLWRRDLFGGAFTAQTLPAVLTTSPDWWEHTDQAWYDWFAGVAPNNPDVVYLGSIQVHRGVRSPTGTWSWAVISRSSSGPSIHPDQHAIAFDPIDPNVVYIGNDGGLYRTPNAGSTWEPLNKGLCIMELQYLAQHPLHEAWLIGGTQDNGTQRYEGEEVWYHVADGDGGDCGANANAPYTCYHTYYAMGMERSTTGGGWGSWTDVGPPVPDAQNFPNGALFYPPMEVNGDTVAQAGRTVYLSRDRGTSWGSVTVPAAAGRASAMDIPNQDTVYVGTETGNVYRITFAGGAWQAPVALAQPRQGTVTDLLSDPTDPNRLWATYGRLGAGGRVFRSDNGGAAWANVSAGLPSIAANAIAVDPANTDIAYVAMDLGVYRSTDAGQTWTPFNHLLPNALVKDLVFHGPSRLLRAATQSRGVWEIAVDQGTMPDVELYLRDSSVDAGRLSPSPSGVDDPFVFGSKTHWWQCVDVKVDAPSFQRPALGDIDFEVFEDDHGIAASGLLHENAQRGRTVRVFVQVHNRGLNPAVNVAVKVFFADASLGLPPLPATFWVNFPDNILPGGSPWQEIGPKAVVPLVDGGRSQIVGFEWAVPAAAASHTCLLAIVSGQNDQIASIVLDVPTLVLNDKKCGLKNLVVVDPPPSVGPRVRALKLNLWRSGQATRYTLGLDRAPTGMIKGIVLSTRLAALARQAGLTRVQLNQADRAALQAATSQHPGLAQQLDTTVAFRPVRGTWLRSFELSADAPEPLVALLEPSPRRGHWSLTQETEDGQPAGGFTFQAVGAL